VLVIAGVARIDSERRTEALAAAIAVMRAVREQPGCISFVISEDLEDASAFLVFQEWSSEEAHRAHLADPRVGAALARFGAVGVLEIDVQRYEISAVGPIV